MAAILWLALVPPVFSEFQKWLQTQQGWGLLLYLYSSSLPIPNQTIVWKKGRIEAIFYYTNNPCSTDSYSLPFYSSRNSCLNLHGALFDFQPGCSVLALWDEIDFLNCVTFANDSAGNYWSQGTPTDLYMESDETDSWFTCWVRLRRILGSIYTLW